MKKFFEKAGRAITGNEDYKFGDISRTVAREVKTGAEEVKKRVEVVVQRVIKNENYHIGDGTKALVESTKEGLEKLGKTLGIVPDFERDVFDVPLGCRRFILRPDLGDYEEEHWSIEFQDSDGNVALIITANKRMNLFVCNSVCKGRPGEESQTQYDLLGLNSERPVYITLHPNLFIITSYNGLCLAYAPHFSYNSDSLACSNHEKAREIWDKHSWVQLTDMHRGEVFWYNQLTELTTRVRPFELGGGSLFQLQGESHNRQSTSGLGGGRELDVSGDAVKTVSHGREDKLASVTEAQWADAQEQLRVAAAAAAATAAAAAAKSQEPPEDFYDNVFDCLIMEDPVFAMDGFTYERRRIEEWLASNSRSPTTGTELASKVVVPNHLLRGRILQWKEANGPTLSQKRPSPPSPQPLQVA